ncbi:tRNA delta(2)-isopentenylpyrophosphate [Plasmodium cynomolgi strain B]|uniref:tRNA dimethylallyltransferase n=1 Tax=Plasmodium cynomolgi (strain B) TaxID=1120755 RepID=K6VG43_PLACD|nr:tRNA delta(2)-isopentenylpyrophosphate [Plasmodium cynomolgi strain B]GAB68287.1 tRNA delta(2)-isopentenylpyrophosphate [Plasmodium cynomolgi strain B]
MNILTRKRMYDITPPFLHICFNISIVFCIELYVDSRHRDSSSPSLPAEISVEIWQECRCTFLSILIPFVNIFPVSVTSFVIKYQRGILTRGNCIHRKIYPQNFIICKHSNSYVAKDTNRCHRKDKPNLDLHLERRNDWVANTFVGKRRVRLYICSNLLRTKRRNRNEKLNLHVLPHFESSASEGKYKSDVRLQGEEKIMSHTSSVSGVIKKENGDAVKPRYGAENEVDNNVDGKDSYPQDSHLPVQPNLNKTEKQKIILIIGVTCSGKTKFSIDLCEELLKNNIKSEIISADSMQVYQKFKIGIAKVEEEEKRDIKHHLLDVCGPKEEFNVHKFINHTIPIIRRISENKKLAIVVGGTLLYIESLLWESVVDLEEAHSETHEDKGGKRSGTDPYEHKTNEELHAELKRVDEERANQLHQNDRKRICRSLDIFYSYNKKHSELIKMKNHKNNHFDRTRYAPCVFYLDYDNDDVLRGNIKKRVDEMISKGLLDEAIKLKKLNENTNVKLFGKGINQSIAYKEFDTYIEKKINNVSNEDLFNLCKENLIRKTYRYAKRQRRWILNRFVKCYNIPLNRVDVSRDYPEQLAGAVQRVLKFCRS